ncbi:MAG TPA: Na+/H+ antiporter NhaA [Casimicrobiaceae bacterium]|nr:Na+/H+ antiporter NhaA [Casimicrobiaceae bacterium]
MAHRCAVPPIMPQKDMPTAVAPQRDVNGARDHVRGGGISDAVTVVLYGDYLCPYCRRLRPVINNLRRTLGERLAYVYRHFPNERAHPGATLLARVAEAAGCQGHFWEMHDWLYERELPVSGDDAIAFAASLGLDMDRFARDLDSEQTRGHVEQDFTRGRRDGVTGTPTVFVDGLRYDGAWDFHSLLEAIERPLAEHVKRSARAFANLPASAGLMLLIAAAIALLCANTPLAPYYRALIATPFVVGPSGHVLSLTVADWLSEGFLGLFFLVVGLEIRREMSTGALADVRAAALPVVAAIGGVIAPAAIYLLFNEGAARAGWAVPTATDVAFTLGILALLGRRVPTGLRVFVAALAVVDDVLSVLTLAIFYPHGFSAPWLAASAVAVALLVALNRSRTYAAWPYALVTAVLAVFLHAAGVHAALAGVILAVFLPTRPTPAAAPLVAQAANALADLEYTERELEARRGRDGAIDQQPAWEFASRNLSAASARLLSPADRIERAIAPWTTYLILPLFAVCAAGVDLRIDILSPESRSVLLGVVCGLVVGKPLGVALASWLAIKAKIAVPPDDVTLRGFLGAACLCGVGDTMALLMADQAFPQGDAAAVAKIGILIGSMLAACIGAAVLATQTRVQPITAYQASGAESPR